MYCKQWQFYQNRNRFWRNLHSMFSSGLLFGIIALLFFVILLLVFRNYKQKRDMELELVKQRGALSDLEIKVHELAERKFEEYKGTILHIEQERIIAEQKV